jgi:hypothetical protein
MNVLIKVDRSTTYFVTEDTEKGKTLATEEAEEAWNRSPNSFSYLCE